MPLWIDGRVGSKEFLTPLQQQGIDARTATLDSGDFAWTGHGPDGDCEIGVERKALTDLITSIRDGRLTGMPTENGDHDGQLVRMRDSYDVVWLLVEGVWTTDDGGRLYSPGRRRPQLLPGGMTRDGLFKHLLSIELQFDIHIVWTTGKMATAHWLSTAYRWWTDKEWSAHQTLKTVHRAVGGLHRMSRFREMVQPLPDVGFEWSKTFDVAFAGNLDRFLHSTTMELSEVTAVSSKGVAKRFGQTRAERLSVALATLRGEVV